MVLWTDKRATTRLQSRSDIYGARVDPAGTVLDPNGLHIIGGGYPRIVFDGTNFFAVWRHGHSDIRGARITTSGTVLDNDVFTIGTGPWAAGRPDIAFDGTNFLVVWHSTGTPISQIRGARVTPSGTVLDPDGIAISNVGPCQKYPRLAFGGRSYMVVWEDRHQGGRRGNVIGARVTPGGSVLDPGGRIISGGWNEFQGRPAIAFDGTNYLVVWVHNMDHSDLHGWRLNQSCKAIDPRPFVIASAIKDQAEPEVAFNGTDYVVIWSDGRGKVPYIYAARVDPSGTVIDPDGFAVAPTRGAQYNPAIASGNSGQLLACYSSFHLRGNLLNPQLPLEATVEMKPDTVNLKSKGVHVTAYIELPEGYDPVDIDVSTVTLNEVLRAKMSPTSVGDFDRDGIPDRMVRFHRKTLVDLILAGPRWSNREEFEVTVAGDLVSGDWFSGTHIVGVVNRDPYEGSDPEPRPDGALSVVPMPFKKTVRISYEVPVYAPVSVRIYDGAGRLVETLVEDHRPAGRHVVTWDRKARDGIRVGAGVYFIRLEQGETVLIRKLLAVQ
jgi:hypothetical protein